MSTRSVSHLRRSRRQGRRPSRPLKRQKGYRNLRDLRGIRRIRFNCEDDTNCKNNFKCHPTKKICMKQYDTYGPFDYNRTKGEWYKTDRGHIGYIHYPSDNKLRKVQRRSKTKRKIKRINTYRPRQRKIFK